MISNCVARVFVLALIGGITLTAIVSMLAFVLVLLLALGVIT